jgi:hypothetical protein
MFCERQVASSVLGTPKMAQKLAKNGPFSGGGACGAR